MLRKIMMLGLLAFFLPSLALLAQDNGHAATCETDQQAYAEGLHSYQLESSNVERNYLLYVPETYDPGTPTPLILSLHGRSSNALQQTVLSEWNLLADEEGFIVVYPNALGTPTQWNTTIPTATRPNEDLIFITDLLDTLER